MDKNARPLLSLHHDFLPPEQLRELQEYLLDRWPLMDAEELAAGYSAVNIDMNRDGASVCCKACSAVQALPRTWTSILTDELRKSQVC